MLKLYDRILKVAPRNVPVVVQGESGVGKELVVREIHRKSPRKDGPFVPVDCGAIPPDLMESELFGRAKGGFTGASTDKAGLFEEASKGTIFLDEIANLPPAMQVKLLRVLQEGEVRRVGSNKLIPLDARLLAATNKDLELEVKEGRFRGDLLQRISVFPIKVPPLRDRELDVALLCNHFIQKHAVDLDSNVKRLSDEALEVLARFSWPWNVRQLENVIREALIEAGPVEEIDSNNEAIRTIAEAIKQGGWAIDSRLPTTEAKPSDEVASNGFEDLNAAEIWAAIKNGKVRKTLPEWSAHIGVPKTLAVVELMVEDYRGYPTDAETRLLFNSSYDACWKGWMHRNKGKKTSGKLSQT
jgi:DNA-binding NtrC family response regulator